MVILPAPSKTRPLRGAAQRRRDAQECARIDSGRVPVRLTCPEIYKWLKIDNHPIVCRSTDGGLSCAAIYL